LFGHNWTKKSRRLKNSKMKINATLHCHGPWTDMASGKFDIERFPRDIQRVADLAVSKGLDLVGLTDLSGKNYVCEVYRPLVEVSDSKLDRYERIRQSGTSVSLVRKEDGRRIDFGRALEILSSDAHVLVLGTSANVLGGRPLEDVLYESREAGATIVADHPCYTIKLGKGMGAERVRRFRREGLIDAVEENGNIAKVLEWIGKYNQRAVELGKELNIPVIADCDGNTARDMGTMFTSYDIPEDPADRFKAVLELIRSADFSDSRIERKGWVKPFRALPLHVVRGFYSIFRARVGWIERGLPAC
jgi:hypothetical protein